MRLSPELQILTNSVGSRNPDEKEGDSQRRDLDLCRSRCEPSHAVLPESCPVNSLETSEQVIKEGRV